LYATEFDDKSDLLAIGGEVDGVTIWNVQTGDLVHRIELAPSDTVTALSFSPDGKKLAVGVAAHPWDGTVYVWDISQLRSKSP
jgi:WD40 repeat protein